MATSSRLIKKYPNRRLYDTQTSAYITLADVKQLVLENEDFRVVDAKSDEDLTRSILLQIILEEEASGAPLFTSQMLSQIIRFYGHAMQGMMGAYLEKSMGAFVDIQNKFQEQSKAFYDGKNLPSSPELWAQFMQVQTPMAGADAAAGPVGLPELPVPRRGHAPGRPRRRHRSGRGRQEVAR